MIRRAAITAAILISFLAGAAGALVAFRTDLAEGVLLSRLAAAGVPAARLKVAEVGLGGARITGISLGAGTPMAARRERSTLSATSVRKATSAVPPRPGGL